MKYLRIFSLPLFFLFFVFVFQLKSYATSGCCSWHGGVGYCDSSVGRYVCNDGTYSPSCGCNYIAPKPTCDKPDFEEGVTFEKKLSNASCTKYNLNASWDYGWSEDGYSLKLDKSSNTSIGDSIDTEETSYNFKNLTPGKYYLHIKSVNSCGGSKTYHYKVELKEQLPDFSYTLNSNNNETVLNYQTKCAESINYVSNDKVINIPLNTGKVTLKQSDTPITYTFNIKQGKKVVKKEVSVPAITKRDIVTTASQEKAVSGKSEKSEKSDNSNIIPLLFFSSPFLYILYHYKIKPIFKKQETQ